MYLQLRVCPYRDPHANHEPLAVQEFDDDGIWVDAWDEPLFLSLSLFFSQRRDPCRASERVKGATSARFDARCRLFRDKCRVTVVSHLCETLYRIRHLVR